MLRRRFACVLCWALTLTIALAVGSTAFAQADSRASVRGYAALTPSGTVGAASATAGARPTSTGSGAGIASVAGDVGRSTVELSAESGDASSASATVSAQNVLLLGGRVAISGLTMEVAAHATGDSFAGGIAAASATGVVIDGEPVSPGLGSRYELAGVGAVVFFEQVSDGSKTVRANGLRLEVSAPDAPLPAGQPFVLGHIEATVRAPDPAEAVQPGSAANEPEAVPEPREPQSDPSNPSAPPAPQPQPTSPAPAAPAPLPIAPAAPIILPRRPAPTGVLAPTDARYLFPVHGKSSFIDDYGAPRSSTGWHHGNDIFAPTGTPVLAVTDGTLSKVGVNRLGGNRLWLTDDDGNEFYYAHLSAYAPSTINGAEVSAGEVIGFVGNSGEAITTPPHLHFELHPGGGDSINPYPFLVAWQRRGALPLAFRAAAVSPGPAPAAGAVLVGIEPASDRDTEDADGLAGVAR